jgi:tRNA (guanine9-N1)-methyltransferase
MENDARSTLDKEPGDFNGAENATVQLNEDITSNNKDSNGQTIVESQATENGLKRKRTPPPEGMSRSAYKKLKRQQEWEARKSDRKAKKREKERSKKEARRAAIAAGEEIPSSAQKPRKEKSTLVPVTFVIDCGFDELMTENEIKSLASQITRCYSDNSKAKYRAHLSISSFNGRLRQRFDTVLEKQYAGWKGVKFYDEDFVDVAEKARKKMADAENGGEIEGALAASEGAGPRSRTPEKGEVIYLSSESENTIERLDPYCTYVIGGLVDRNRHKGICYRRACDRGIKTAKLPIGEFMEMNSRYVLATNHVNEIMLHWLDIGNWGDAFMKVIPKRKGGILKRNGAKEASNEVEEVDDMIEEEVRPANEADDKADGATAQTDQQSRETKDVEL